MKYLVCVADFETSRGFMHTARIVATRSLPKAKKIAERSALHFIVKNGGRIRRMRWGYATREATDCGPRRWATITTVCG